MITFSCGKNLFQFIAGYTIIEKEEFFQILCLQVKKEIGLCWNAPRDLEQYFSLWQSRKAETKSNKTEIAIQNVMEDKYLSKNNPSLGKTKDNF